MKILITGTNGFIGKNLYKYLLKKENYDVDKYIYNKNKNIPSVKKYNLIIHLGAISSTTATDTDKILKQNFYFTKKLIDECLFYKINLQISSSASVYGNNYTRPVNEKDKCFPSSPYSWSKYLIDDYLNKYIFKKLNHSFIQSFRYFNVFGEYESHKKDQMSPVSKFILQSKKNNKISLFYNSKFYKRDFIYVGDICRIHEKMFTKKYSGIINLGTGKTYSFYEIANLISKKYKSKINYIKMPNNVKKNYQHFTCSNNKKIIKLIGHYNFRKIEEYLS